MARSTRLAGAVAAVVLAAAVQASAQPLPPDVDRAVRENLRAYRDAWLAGDANAVMATFADDAVVLPSGRPPLTTPEAIRGFWFPTSGPATTILEMELDVERTAGSGELAYTWGRGSLTFSYEQEGRTQTVTSRSTFVNVLRKDAAGGWKTVCRMWSDLPGR